MTAEALKEYAFWMGVSLLAAVALVALFGLGAFLFLFVHYVVACVVYGAVLAFITRWYMQHVPNVGFW